MKKGFTLVELLAVIIILAIVMVITIPKVLNSIKDSKIKALESDIVGVYKSLERNINRSQLDLTDNISDSISYQKDCPLKYWSERKSTCKYTYDSAVGMSSLKVKVDWDIDDEYSYLTYDGLNRQYIDGNQGDLSNAVYGVRFENSSTGIRLGDAVGMTYSDPSASEEITSSFDTAAIYNEIVEVQDSYGNVFVKIPKFYIKKTKSTGNIWTYEISKSKVDNDYYLPACFMDEQTNTEVSYILVGKYIASLNNGKLESKKEANPFAEPSHFPPFNTISVIRSAAKANGAGYQLMDIHVFDVLQALFYVEFATTDSQSIMTGFVSSPDGFYVANGMAQNIQKTGSPISNRTGYNVMKYRGIENLWGNTYQFIDGISINEDTVYVSKNASDYANINDTTIASSQNAVDYQLISSIDYAYGFITELGYDSNYPFVNLPIAVEEPDYDTFDFENYDNNPEAAGIYKDISWASYSDNNKFLTLCSTNDSVSGGGLTSFDVSFSFDEEYVSTRLVKKPISSEKPNKNFEEKNIIFESASTTFDPYLYGGEGYVSNQDISISIISESTDPKMNGTEYCVTTNGSTCIPTTTGGTVSLTTTGQYTVCSRTTYNDGSIGYINNCGAYVVDKIAPSETTHTPTSRASGNTNITIIPSATDNFTSSAFIKFKYCKTTNGTTCIPSINLPSYSFPPITLTATGQYTVCTLAIDYAGNEGPVTCSEPNAYVIN